jgi:hypothetical protein
MSAKVVRFDTGSRAGRLGRNNMNHVLLMDTNGLSGMYVVTNGLNSQKVVASAKTPEEAYNQAVARGVSDPVIVYVPTESEKTAVLWQNS